MKLQPLYQATPIFWQYVSAHADLHVQEFQQRSTTNPGSELPSTSGRIDPASDYGLGLEDSWDLSDDQYSPFPASNSTASTPTDSSSASQWATNPNSNMSGASELWSRVSTVSSQALQTLLDQKHSKGHTLELVIHLE